MQLNSVSKECEDRKFCCNPVSKRNSKTAMIAVSSVGLTRCAKSVKFVNRSNEFDFYSAILIDSS